MSVLPNLDHQQIFSLQCISLLFSSDNFFPGKNKNVVKTTRWSEHAMRTAVEVVMRKKWAISEGFEVLSLASNYSKRLYTSYERAGQLHIFVHSNVIMREIFITKKDTVSECISSSMTQRIRRKKELLFRYLEKRIIWLYLRSDRNIQKLLNSIYQKNLLLILFTLRYQLIWIGR